MASILRALGGAHRPPPFELPPLDEWEEVPSLPPGAAFLGYGPGAVHAYWCLRSLFHLATAVPNFPLVHAPPLRLPGNGIGYRAESALSSRTLENSFPEDNLEFATVLLQVLLALREGQHHLGLVHGNLALRSVCMVPFAPVFALNYPRPVGRCLLCFRTLAVLSGGYEGAGFSYAAPSSLPLSDRLRVIPPAPEGRCVEADAYQFVGDLDRRLGGLPAEPGSLDRLFVRALLRAVLAGLDPRNSTGPVSHGATSPHFAGSLGQAIDRVAAVLEARKLGVLLEGMPNYRNDHLSCPADTWEAGDLRGLVAARPPPTSSPLLPMEMDPGVSYPSHILELLARLRAESRPATAPEAALLSTEFPPGVFAPLLSPCAESLADHRVVGEGQGASLSSWLGPQKKDAQGGPRSDR
jgi:hypothetical protein